MCAGAWERGSVRVCGSVRECAGVCVCCRQRQRSYRLRTDVRYTVSQKHARTHSLNTDARCRPFPLITPFLTMYVCTQALTCSSCFPFRSCSTQVLTLDVDKQAPGPKWTLRQWCLYWRERQPVGDLTALPHQQHPQQQHHHPQQQQHGGGGGGGRGGSEGAGHGSAAAAISSQVCRCRCCCCCVRVCFCVRCAVNCCDGAVVGCSFFCMTWRRLLWSRPGMAVTQPDVAVNLSPAPRRAAPRPRAGRRGRHGDG